MLVVFSPAASVAMHGGLRQTGNSGMPGRTHISLEVFVNRVKMVDEELPALHIWASGLGLGDHPTTCFFPLPFT